MFINNNEYKILVLNNNKKPRGFMQSCFPFLCILNVVVFFIIFL